MKTFRRALVWVRAKWETWWLRYGSRIKIMAFCVILGLVVGVIGGYGWSRAQWDGWQDKYENALMAARGNYIAQEYRIYSYRTQMQESIELAYKAGVKYGQAHLRKKGGKGK